MKTAFDICIKNHRILVYPQGKNLVEREIRAAINDLADAKIGLSAYSDDSGHPFRTKAATCRSEATLGSHLVP